MPSFTPAMLEASFPSDPSHQMQHTKGHSIRQSSPHRLHPPMRAVKSDPAWSIFAELDSMGHCHV